MTKRSVTSDLRLRGARLTWPSLALLIGVSTLTFGTQADAGENASSPVGEPFKEWPTLHCLGVRWKIKGDANQNAIVRVDYRKVGEEKWRQGLPLFRTRPNPRQGKVSTRLGVPGGWHFAGSIVGLTPDTEYEVKLYLDDPDGGKAEKVYKQKTWKEPVEPKGMKVVHVAPGAGGGKGTEEDPYKGMKAALAAANPGVLFLLKKGEYAPFGLNKSGTPAKPIIVRAAGDGEVIIGPDENMTKGSVVAGYKKKCWWFEDLTIRGKFYGINCNISSHFVIRRCKFRKVAKGFNASKGGNTVSVHHFISDNDFIGPTKWPRTKGIETYAFTNMSGGGHVVCYNRIQRVGDGAHGTSNGSLSGSDFHNNDLNICTDDGLESDHSDFNIRLFNNRIRNVAHGITSQPGHAGPTYIFRNVIYNCTYSPFKLHNHTTGPVIFHNTCFKHKNCFNIVPARESVLNVWMRNNLFLTTKGVGLYVGTPNMQKCDIDNDGYGGFSKFAQWNARHHYKTIADAKKGGQIYKGKGAHLIDPKTCFEKGTLPPANRDKIYTPEEIDHRLAEGSDAIDKGVVLPGFNDGFKGKAPDLGALEFGGKPPHYGPRNGKVLSASAAK